MSDILTVTVSGLAHDGRGIARMTENGDSGRGAVLFVAGALPGQTVRARIVRRKARLLEADLLDVLRQAPDAVPPLCPHQSVCGGCPLQIMPYSAQLRWKESLALEALHRIGRLDRALLNMAWEAPQPSPTRTAFRNKMEFAFGPGADGGMALGLRRRGGAGVVAVPGCVLPPAGARDILEAVRDMAEESGLPPYVAPAPRRDTGRDTGRGAGADAASHGFWRFLILRHGRKGDDPAPRWWALCVTSAGGAAGRAAARALGERLLQRFPAVAAFIHEERQRPDALAAGERRVLCLDEQGREDAEAALLRLPLGGRLFGLDAASFFQVNTAAAQELARLVTEALGSDCVKKSSSLLDLYCGVGAPGQLQAPAFERLLGLEHDRRAVALARRNAERAGLNHCRYEAGDAAALLERPRRDRAAAWDTALADPPRAGLTPRVLTSLLKLRPRRILYISCNPATLGRDAQTLQEHYRLERLTGVDLFPHTPHLECLSLWRLRA
ncbi:class I SAM-dependent RNA methyltransferase [Desulfovibrio sp. SGI.169]|uniref:class I SAM-dependent RNA methyltransferase n=1 Tax=Desulfovibrio sp. SGI.169 TaxID=3420561 RepID=UPI003D006C56